MSVCFSSNPTAQVRQNTNNTAAMTTNPPRGRGYKASNPHSTRTSTPPFPNLPLGDLIASHNPTTTL